MSPGPVDCELVGVAGPFPETLEGLMSAPGLVFVLVGLRYPANVGFILRSAEVAGAAGVVLANDWRGSERDEASRVGMRADRFLPVLESDAGEAVVAGRRAGRRLVAFETTGDRTPWEIDFRPPAIVFVGSETTGLPAALLAELDDLVRIPTRGIIPSYNVQAAVSVALGEWLRQEAADG
jgi:TrmH family RNA methyltransferase